MTQAHTHESFTTTTTARETGLDHIRVRGVSHSYADRRVLTDVTLTVSPGTRLGLIGENGAGKSTLLRLIAGAEQVESGEIRRPHRTGILWQEVQFERTDTLATLIEDAIASVRAIERELDESALALADPIATEGEAASLRYAAALEAAERAEVWSVDARRDALLDGLGVSGIPLQRRLDEVSGGQRSRVALAALLLQAPDALLLDEPSNHLDDSAAAFLESQLRAWRGPVLFASHDRAFLDGVATQLLDLDPARSAMAGGGVAPASGSTVFGGNYSDYLGAKASERERWERQHADEQDELKRLRLTADVTARTIAPNRARRDNEKMGYDLRADRQGVAISRRVRSADQRYRTLAANQLRKPPAALSFAGIPRGSQTLGEEAGTLVQLRDVGIEGRLAVRSFRIEPESRILITGHNGAGKSTLLGVLAGTLAAQSGTVSRRKGLRVAQLEQDVEFAHPGRTVRDTYDSTVGERRAEQVPLSTLGLIAARDENREVGTLSIGQQRRLALALIIARPPHVFLLDEPTNHLSLALASELEEALGSYPGAVVIASHDRWLRRNWTGTRVSMSQGVLGEALVVE